MRVGLFFGSFNPIHRSHVIVARTLKEWAELDEVRFVVTPHNPHKQKANLLDDATRFHLVELALEKREGLLPEPIEFKLSQPNYTVDTLAALTELEPNNEFFLLMGEDNLASFPKWREPERIVELVHLLVYPRPGVTPNPDNPWRKHPKVQFIEGPMMDRSSTAIRHALGLDADPSDDLPSAVANYIKDQGLYQNPS